MNVEMRVLAYMKKRLGQKHDNHARYECNRETERNANALQRYLYPYARTKRTRWLEECSTNIAGHTFVKSQKRLGWFPKSLIQTVLSGHGHYDIMTYSAFRQIVSHGLNGGRRNAEKGSAFREKRVIRREQSLQE